MLAPLVLVQTTHDTRLLARGSDGYLTLSPSAYATLKGAADQRLPLPASIQSHAQRLWGLDLAGQRADQALLVRAPTEHAYENASWELNLRCDYDCAHCYLGAKQAADLPMAERLKVLEAMRDLGVYRLQITGGEPLIDRLFSESYLAAYELGMLIRVSTNASQLHRARLLQLFTDYPPLHLTISLYGATAESYEALTRTPAGTFARYLRGLQAASEAGIRLRINGIITRHNDHETGAMRELAESLGAEYHEYGRLTATYFGTGDVLDAQSTRVELRRKREPFVSCNAGKTFFHVDPLGRASICKIGREPWVQINEVGAAGVTELARISDELMARSGACTGCGAQSTCSTCPPMVADYRQAGAPHSFYCQH